MKQLTAFFLLVALHLSAEQIQHEPFIVHVIPKCGTHYIQKIVHMLTGKLPINHRVTSKNLELAEEENKILWTLESYTTKSIHTLKRRQYKAIAVIRDPRDALISQFLHMRNFTGRKRDFFTVPLKYDVLTIEEQLKILITGTLNSSSYLDFYKIRIGWALNPYTHTVRYENLVGSEGGGSDEVKRQEIQKLVDYLNINISPERFEWTVDNMYSKSPEIVIQGHHFKRASSGAWKTLLNAEHKLLIKERIGPLLKQLGYEKNSKW